MLNFLRKYQKIVFGVVTAALILSLSLFGATNNSGSQNVKEEDFVLGAAYDGSSISKLSIEKMMRFLATDCYDLDMQSRGAFPNLFNDGVIRKDFLESGLGAMLAKNYFEHLEKDLTQRLEKQKKFKPYAHPQASFLSAENIYMQFVPALHGNLSKIKEEGFEVSPDTFQTLADIYIESSRLPTQYLRQFLAYQENQYHWLKKDPYLREGDLSLFYFHNLEDWFGPNYIELVSQFIHNAALFAKEKGYKVSFEEAKADLLKSGYEALKAQAQDQEVNGEILNKYWKQQLAMLRLDEKAAVGIWQKVLLFRKLFDDYGHSIFLDKLSYEQYQDYTTEATEVKLYSLPEDYKIPDFRSFLRFQAYLEAVSQDERSARSLLPSIEKKSISSIEKSSPELLERVYEVELAHITRKEVAMNVSLKETWKMQQDPNHFDKLKAEFKFLHGENPKNEEERLLVLDRLSKQDRLEVDEFTRGEILKTKEELIKQALDKRSKDSKVLHISLGNEEVSLDGVYENQKFIALLNQAPLQQETEWTEEMKEAQERLAFFTQDNQNFYKIQVLKKPIETKLLSYKEAESKGVLDKLLDKNLLSHKAHAVAKEPAAFQNEDGSVKDFATVKDDVGRLMYKDLLKLIEKDFTKSGKKIAHDSQKDFLDFAAKHRLYHFVKVAKEDIEYLGEESMYLDRTNPLHLSESEECIKRNEKAFWTDETTFSMKDNSWSNINVNDAGSVSFYQVVKKSKGDTTKILDEIRDGQSLISKDAKRFLMSEVIQLIHSNDGIHLEKILKKAKNIVKNDSPS